MDEAEFQDRYGRWEPLTPAAVAALLGPGLRWYVAGGHAARLAAPPRRHADIDVAVALSALPRLRSRLSGWHVWQANDGGLRPLFGDDELQAGCEQLWLRRSARHPWVADLLLDRSTRLWVFKKDPRVRVAWSRALTVRDGVTYLRPELALLHKAHLDRPKDREDLAVAALAPPARRWLVDTLDLLGHHDWARAAAAAAPRRRDRSS